MRRLSDVAIASLVILGVLLPCTANAQKDSRPDVPAAIQAPASEEVVLVAHASGSQIYTCQAAADGSSPGPSRRPTQN